MKGIIQNRLVNDFLFVNVNGVALAYTKEGKGKPLLLVHGNGKDHTRKIAKAIPKSTIRILKGEGHGSYIVHNKKLGLIMGCL